MICHQSIGMDQATCGFCGLFQTAEIFQIIKIIEKNCCLSVVTRSQSHSSANAAR